VQRPHLTFVLLLQVDCSEYRDLCEEFGVSGDDDSALGVPYVAEFKAGSGNPRPRSDGFERSDISKGVEAFEAYVRSRH